MTMHYAALSPKQRRIIESDVKTLLSSRAFLKKPTLDDLKHFGLFHPSIKHKSGTLYLSQQGVAALRRLINSLAALPVLGDAVSNWEIETLLKQKYSIRIVDDLQTTVQEFVNEVVDALVCQIKHYEYLVKIEGLDLTDIDLLSLGSVRIQRSNPALFEHVAFGGSLDRDDIYSQFENSLWLIGSAKGSPDVADKRFDHRAYLTLGTLGICGAVLYKGAIWRSRVRVVTSPLENRKAISSLRWETGGDNPLLSRKWGAEQNLPLTSESVAYLNKVCFLDRLSQLPDLENRSELENAAIRAIYWFADAYRDSNHIMQFVKLWTCAECFFSIDKEKITELNAQGIAAILTFAGFEIVDVDDYLDCKRKVKRLYDLRSQAIHRAEFSHIELNDISELSHWIAWVVISMVALAGRGYKTLRQVHEQIKRLDGICSGEKS